MSSSPENDQVEESCGPGTLKTLGILVELECESEHGSETRLSPSRASSLSLHLPVPPSPYTHTICLLLPFACVKVLKLIEKHLIEIRWDWEILRHTLLAHGIEDIGRNCQKSDIYSAYDKNGRYS